MNKYVSGVRLPDPGKGEVNINLASVGEPYVPRTAAEKQAWGSLVKQGLNGFLNIGERVGATPDEVDRGIEMLGFRELYDMSLGEGIR